MQVSLSNHKSTELAIKKLEVQVGQLPKQLDERPIGSFVAYTKKNPKEEYKAVLTRSHRRENIKREERDEWVLEDVSNKEGKNKEREEDDEKKDVSKEKSDNVLPIKTKMQLAREARREIIVALVKDIPYPLMPSKKAREHYFARFMDIFKNL